MRIWAVEDNKAIPTDLVREQDFILRVRRLQRLGTPHLALNLVLSQFAILAEHHQTLEEVQKKLAEFARVTNGTYAEMSNGDVFLIWEELQDADLLAERILAAILPSEAPRGDIENVLHIYHLPRDYTALRERANYYVEVVHNISARKAESGPSMALQTEAARGPLTAWSVDQIGKLLNNIDLKHYARRQPIYRHIPQIGKEANPWQLLAEEYFISFEDLRRDRFPKLEIITPEHLFLALCETLDHTLLTNLTQDIDSVLGQPLHLNLSVATVTSSAFAQLTHAVPDNMRANLTFELHRGDLFQDFALTLNAIQSLRHEGFKVALDAITPDLAGYVDLQAFDVDYIKINVSKDRADQLSQPAIRKRLEAITPDRLIFFRCDNEKALAVGFDLGIDKFQGWLIDDRMVK